LSDPTDRPKGKGRGSSYYLLQVTDVPKRRLPSYRVEQRLAAILFLDYGELGVQIRGAAEMLTMILIVLRYLPT
jgi:hypothetical protein